MIDQHVTDSCAVDHSAQWHFPGQLDGSGFSSDPIPIGAPGDSMSKTSTGRRDFLLSGAALGAAAAVSPLASQAQAQSSGFVIPVLETISLPVVGSSQRFPVRRIYCVGRNYLEHIREL